MSNESKIYLNLKNLVKIYDKTLPAAVQGINLTIVKGEFIVFLGPSGCGKTTIMRMIAGLEEVTEGEISIEGKSIVNLPPKDRGVSMIFQSYAIWPHMTVYGNISYPLKLQKIPKDEIKEIVEDVAKKTDVDKYLERYPDQLSGGQRQRVAVARAIAVKPKLFLMDEPLSNLDAKLRVSMRSELRKIHDDLGATSIFVTHDQAEAMSLADRIVVMNHGTIEQIGTPNEIYHNSASMFVAKFIGMPPANFFDVKVIKDKRGIVLVGNGFNKIINSDLKTTLESKYINKVIVLSVRPEDFVINGENSTIDATIQLLEPQGSHAIILTDIDGTEVKLTTSDIHLKVKDKIKIGLGDKFLLFDKQTEKRI